MKKIGKKEILDSAKEIQRLDRLISQFEELLSSSPTSLLIEQLQEPPRMRFTDNDSGHIVEVSMAHAKPVTSAIRAMFLGEIDAYNAAIEYEVGKFMEEE